MTGFPRGKNHGARRLDSTTARGDNRGLMPCRGAIRALIAALLLVSSLLGPASARAQGASGLVVIRLVTPAGAPAAGAVVELLPFSRMALARTGQSGDAALSWSVPAGAYRFRAALAGFRPVERAIDVAPGTVVSITVQLAVATGTAETTAPSDAAALAYQTRFDRRMLEGLPSARTVPSLLDTAHAFLIADRIDGGGIWTPDMARLGGQGSSALQTTFRLGSTDVTDPLFVGSSLFYPDLGVLEAVTTEAADVDPASTGPGPTITMVLRRPTDRWTGSAQVLAAPSGLLSEARTPAPIARLESWTDGSAAAGGPLVRGLGLFAAGRVTDGRRVEREQAPRLDSTARSFTAHLIGQPRSGQQFTALASFAGLTRPSTLRARFADRDREQDDRLTVLSAVWEHVRASGVWSLTAAFQSGLSDASAPGSGEGGTIERLRDGPPLQLVEAARQDRRRWDVGFGLEPATRRWIGREHIVRLGAALGGASARGRPGAEPAFAELVNGQPARVWNVTHRGAETRWGVTSASGFVSDRLLLADGLTVNAALRVEMDRGSADGAANDIGWVGAAPRLSLQWRPGASGKLAISTGYGWYRHRLPLGVFAIGDPAGPSGVMYRWDDANGDGVFTTPELTAVAAVGSCCAGADANRIDDGLRRPTTRAFHIGAEQRLGSWRLAVMGLDRREHDGLVLFNTGVTLADYTVTFVEDPGVDVAGLSGFNTLPLYDRRPGSFGRDRYVLGNSTEEPARYQGVEITVAREAGDRWYFRFGGSAYRSEGAGANRGYRPDENDQGLIGEAFATPNAGTSARGRLFYDRAYVMKVLGAYTAPGPLRAAFVARYQDGQPFSRVLIAEGLNQGAEIVQTYPRGGQRFTYTLTLDTRAELRWPTGGGRALSLVVDAFNLLNIANEVEEDVVTGPGFRTITAVQPPRVVHVGVRFIF